MFIFKYNGSALVAMVGKNCFVIASDRRLGVQLQTIATDFQRIYKVHDKLFIDLSSLATGARDTRVSDLGGGQGRIGTVVYAVLVGTDHGSFVSHGWLWKFFVGKRKCSS